MIIVNATIKTSEATILATKEAIKIMEQASQAEAGCEDYTFSVELNDPSVLRITECWQNKEALAAHFKTPHMADFQAVMAQNPPENLKVNFYDATAIDSPMG